ncbi:MAG: hypothetical protein DMG77_05505 [Acidobacteria bacterium]|nr:MAG: hypothetical protein DMG77_05505 [Acidobacteriota bacterium]
MRVRISDPGKPLPSVRIVCVAVLTLLVSGWTTCNAMLVVSGCESSLSQPQISSLSPGTIPGNTESLLTVNGNNFVPQSRIMWNGTAMPTTFVNSHRLQTTITPQTLASVSSAAGIGVEISVMSPAAAAAVTGCQNGGSSSTLVLIIN